MLYFDEENIYMWYLTITPFPLFPRKGRGPKMGFSPMARHLGVAAHAAILSPYETRFYDVIGLTTFSSLPLVGFCWTGDG